MSELNKAVQVAINQLDKRTEELKEELKQQRDVNQALRALDEKANTLKEQLSLLAEVPVPTDLLDFYVKTGGNVWVSKLRGAEHEDELEVTTRHRLLTLGEAGQHRGVELNHGAYRIVVLLLPQEIPEERKRDGRWVDDYGEHFSLNG